MVGVRFVIILDRDNRPSLDSYVVAIEDSDEQTLRAAANAWDGNTKLIAKRRYLAKRLSSVTVQRDGAEHPGAAYVLVA